MIEELLYWDIRNKQLKEFGEKVGEINKEFMLLDLSLSNGSGRGLVNMHRARSLSKKISNMRDEKTIIAERLDNSKKKDRQYYFDQLALREFGHSLFAQDEYIQFFFTKKYNKEWGVESFMNYVFLPTDQFEHNENNGAIFYLENLLRKTKYRAQTRRENLMRDIIKYEVSANPREYEDMLIEQIPKLRKIISDYNIDMGFETKEQIEVQNEILESEKIEKIKDNVENLFGQYREKDLPAIIVDGIKKEAIKFKEKLKPLDSSLQNLIYNLVLSSDDFCSYDSLINTMGVTPNRFHFYREKGNGNIKFYSGDLTRSVGHENFHRLQSFFSRFMPEGLKDNDGEYSLTGRTISEGVPTVLEENFMKWLEKNREKYDISKRDIDIANNYDTEWKGNRLIRLLHSIYHREETPLEKNESRGAHLRLARVAGVPVYADDGYLNSESMPETYYFAFYMFGTKYVQETLKKLEEIEKKRFSGDLRGAKRFLRRNEPIIIQGLLTGDWGWSTHKDFFLKHYWPKARKYCS